MATAKKLNDTLISFINRQHLFFVATAGKEGRVNTSPKGLDTLKVVNHHRILWLNLSGSGNETAAHVRETGRMTLMFCAFDGDPLILRVYGQATVLHPRDPDWEQTIRDFPDLAGSRQIFDLSVDLVQTSCGTGVPVMNFEKSRGEEELVPYYRQMGEQGVREYWGKKNVLTVDGTQTGIFED